MNAEHHVLVMRGERIALELQLHEGESLLIGRSMAAQLMLDDPQASRTHALLWEENGTVWVRDLGSTNGTFLNGRPLKEAASLSDDSLLRIGHTSLQVRSTNDRSGTREPAPLWLEDLQTGLRRRLPVGWLSIDEDAQIEMTAERKLFLSIGDRREPIEPGQILNIGDRSLSVLNEFVAPSPTDLSGQLGLPYRLICPRPARRVRMRDLRTQQQTIVTARRRALLLRTLGERLRHDRHAGRPPIHQGWCTDDEVGLSVWGERWLDNASNRLNVLIHRIRRELEEAGFDPSCLQKRRGSVRIWIQQIDFGTDAP